MSAKSRVKKILDAYSRNPVDRITAEMVYHNSWGEDGICFNGRERSGYSMIVYASGKISVIGTPPEEATLGELKEDCPEMYELALTISNDMRILALREEHTKSYIFEDSYDSHVVEEALKEWKDSTGCFVWLDEKEKADLYAGLLRGGTETTPFRVSEWFEDNNIPFIPAGKATITVDATKGEIRLKYYPVSSDQQHSLSTYDITNGNRCDKQMHKAVSALLAAFGIRHGN